MALLRSDGAEVQISPNKRWLVELFRSDLSAVRDLANAIAAFPRAHIRDISVHNSRIEIRVRLDMTAQHPEYVLIFACGQHAEPPRIPQFTRSPGGLGGWVRGPGAAELLRLWSAACPILRLSHLGGTNLLSRS